MRAWGVTTSGGAGIPFPPPYPADADPSRKLHHDLRLSPQVERAAGCRLVLVDVADPFLRHYAAVSLFAQGTRHVFRQELNTYFDSEAPLGFQVPLVPPDCSLRVGPGATPGARQGFRLESLAGQPGEAIPGRRSAAPARRTVADDFDGDGRSDPFVFVPPGSWYTRRSGDASLEKLGLGGVSAVPVPGDYDGDRVSDRAVFEQGRWQMRLSSSRQTEAASFGGPGYLAAPADYDCDGRTDLAVFHRATGLWYVRPSSTRVGYSLAVGGGADQALPADYDGDGQADLAVRYAASGLWYVRPSGGGQILTVAQRGAFALPVVGDYDGDGRADIAVFEPPTGLWHVRPSSTATTEVTGFGGPADRPAPGDYDGDGRADLAVYDPAGRWSIRYSSTLARLRFQFRSGPRED